MRNTGRFIGLIAAISIGWVGRVLAAAEEDHRDSWRLMHGGEGGGTSGAGISTNITGARSGEHAVILSVESLPNERSRAWASASQTIKCAAGEHFSMQLWIRREGATVSTNATAQGIIEYFEDRECRQPVCQHLRMTTNLPVAGLPREKWTTVQLDDTVPDGATTMRVSILIATHGPSAGRQEIAVDDVKLTVLQPAPVHRRK